MQNGAACGLRPFLCYRAAPRRTMQQREGVQMEYIVIEKFLHQNETERCAALAQLLRQAENAPA